MPDYRNFLPDELATDPSFRRWVLYDDPAEAAFWSEWLDRNPDKEETVDKARHLLQLAEGMVDGITDEEIAQEIDRLSVAIAEKSEEKPGRVILFRLQWYQVAAAMLLLLGIGWWLTGQFGNPKPVNAYQELLDQMNHPLTVLKNTTERPRFIPLPDGSTVVLQPKSQLTFPTSFEPGKRDVFLAGEAFFEVAKNPRQPFYVYAGRLVTKVVGTSFKVSAYPNGGDVKVVVKTGRVAVFPLVKETLARQQATTELQGEVLVPNEQIVLTASTLRLTRSTVPDPKTLDMPIQRQSFVFKATPVSEVFDTLEKSYDVRIVFDAATLKNCYLTASLSDEPLYEKLNLICKTIGAQYEQTANGILITSPGCY